MDTKILNNYYNDQNTYLIYQNGIGAVIDVGYNESEIIKEAENLGVEIKYILLTHCHYDHIEFMEELREKNGAKLVSSELTSDNIQNPDINLSLAGLGRKIYAKKSEITLADGEVINIGDMEVKCIHTPGHTNGGVCFLVEDNLFAGDTLFLRSCGRWDLPTGDEHILAESIKNKLYTLDEGITVYPGHGKSTTIGYEKKFNMIIKG